MPTSPSYALAPVIPIEGGTNLVDEDGDVNRRGLACRPHPPKFSLPSPHARGVSLCTYGIGKV